MFRHAFKPGTPVPRAAMYWVHHYQHRISHLSYLKSSEDFPACIKCGERVRFELALEPTTADHISLDPDFRTDDAESAESKAG